MRRFEVHYSVLALISGMALYVGGALAFCFFAGLMKVHSWFATANYVLAMMAVGVALTYSYRLLTAKGRAVVTIDAAGFKDIRLTATVIPWSAIQSVSPYTLYKANTSTGVALGIDPAFKRDLSIRLGARLFNWANLNFGSVIYVDTRTLDADSDEVAKVAGFYISKQA
jgi:hypothetical protein